MSRTVAITGAASGLGAAVRARVEAAGDRVIGVDLRDAEVVAALSSVAGRAAAIDTVLADCDGVLDGLVPCAGLGPQVKDHALMVSVNYFASLAVLDGLFDALTRGPTRRRSRSPRTLRPSTRPSTTRSSTCASAPTKARPEPARSSSRGARCTRRRRSESPVPCAAGSRRGAPPVCG
jgi:NAD(P)-dependent dehydrogenase (short-subunit alcohol dehydrogenase family)